MKEEEAFCGVGEISLGLRTDKSDCFLHSRSQSCKRVLVAQAQSKRGSASQAVRNFTRSTVSTKFLQIRVHGNACVMIAGSSVCVWESLSVIFMQEEEIKAKMQEEK